METFTRRFPAPRRLPGARLRVLIGVVASGNLEILAERSAQSADSCEFNVSTASNGFGAVWDAVLADFVERHVPGGVVFSINDGGARPDTVMLRLAQACEALKETI